MVPNEKEFDLGESILKDSLNMKRNEGVIDEEFPLELN